ncbi:MAG: tol-pal system protein YbgF, partial [Candidatus Eisenbacteria bacterium]|nr:tol-pal system protein YbgF [Candidatus Eisenbacteria bacterium]
RAPGCLLRLRQAQPAGRRPGGDAAQRRGAPGASRAAHPDRGPLRRTRHGRVQSGPRRSTGAQRQAVPRRLWCGGRSHRDDQLWGGAPLRVRAQRAGLGAESPGAFRHQGVASHVRCLLSILGALLCTGCLGGSGPRPATGDARAAHTPIETGAATSIEARLARIEQRLGVLERIARGTEATLAAEFAALTEETARIREQLAAQQRWIETLQARAGPDAARSPQRQAGGAYPPIALDSTRAPAWSPAVDLPTRGDVSGPAAAEASAVAGDSAVAASAPARPPEQAPGEPAQAAEAGAPEARPPDPPEEGVRLYEVAYEDLKRGNYQLALINLRAFLDRHPETNLADNAQYWIGEAYYAQGQFEVAIEEFRTVVDEHPGEDKEPAAYYKIALSFESLDDASTARRYLEFLIERFPQTREARLARERLARL